MIFSDVVFLIYMHIYIVYNYLFCSNEQYLIRVCKVHCGVVASAVHAIHLDASVHVVHIRSLGSILSILGLEVFAFQSEEDNQRDDDGHDSKDEEHYPDVKQGDRLLLLCWVHVIPVRVAFN